MSKKDTPIELYASVYAFLTDLGHTSAAKALLKDAKLASIDAKGATNLQEAFKSFSAAKRPLASSDGGSAKKAKLASSSSSDSSDSDSSEEEEPVKPVPKPPVPAKKVESSSSSSSSDSSSDSESSDGEEAKPVAVSKPVAVTKPVAATKPKPATAPPSSSSDSSSDDSSDDESEVKAAPSKIATPAKAQIAQTGKAAVIKKAESSSDSSSSDDSSSDSSEDEAPAKPAAKTTPVAKAASAAKPLKPKDSSSSSSDSSSDSDSSDDEAPPAKKPATEKPTLVIPDSASKNNNPDSFKVYVRGLPWAATEKEVKDFFKACGKIVSAELPLGEDGRASGTAFVKFSSQAEFNKAIELDGQYWPGTERWLSIKASSEKPEPKKFEVGVRPDGCNTVFVGNLPWDVTEEVLRETFSMAGEVASVRFAMNEDGSMKGFGHVEFCNGDDTVAAVKLAGTPINGRPCRVDYAPPRASSPRTGGGGRGGPSPRGGRGRGGGRGGNAAPTFASKNKGSIVASSSAKKMTFDD